MTPKTRQQRTGAQTELAGQLSKSGCEGIVITGMKTQYCVENKPTTLNRSPSRRYRGHGNDRQNSASLLNLGHTLPARH
ncbi:hypothetical protein HYI44_02445 [Pseudomonas sp. Y24-6]|nr:hypothetical protein [Pseudomonas sp. Y24-6]